MDEYTPHTDKDQDTDLTPYPIPPGVDYAVDRMRNLVNTFSNNGISFFNKPKNPPQQTKGRKYAKGAFGGKKKF
jgi:hypothetical protein